MKKGLIASYVAGIRDLAHGESYGTILRYFFPEFISALVLYSVPIWIEAYFIGHLKSTPTYATLGATNNVIHFLIKMAEAFSVGTLVLAGQFNGKAEYKEAGRAARDAFWLTCIIGFIIAGALYLGAYWIYFWFGVPAEIINLGVPFLRLRAVSVFFMFIYLAIVGFLRGIKNTRVPMQIFVLGTLILLSLEYVLIFGNFGFPELGLQGSAWASVMQYMFMACAAVAYILFYEENRKYVVDLFSVFHSRTYFKELIILSWPVLLDKTTLAAAYIWLIKMIAPMGTAIVATFSVIKDMERFALAPAIAFAQVITLLVSNDYGRQEWDAIKSNIKKTVFIASFFVLSILVIFSMMPHFIIGLFDKKGEFTLLAVRAFPVLSVLAFMDLLQVVLSGAMRGAANVKTVMMVRLMIVFGVFVPVSYALSFLPIEDFVLKFMIIYGSFYVCNGIMSIIYINRFRSDDWKSNVVKK